MFVEYINDDTKEVAMKMIQIFALFVVGLLFVLSCNSNPEDDSGVGPGIPETVINAAPAMATVAQVDYIAKVYPYRDFMPGRGQAERGLIAIAQICRGDLLAIPRDLHLKHLWVFQGRECWSAKLGEEQEDFGSGVCRVAIAREGPKWEPGSKVDVVIGFVIGDSGMYIVRTATTEIERAD